MRCKPMIYIKENVVGRQGPEARGRGLCDCRTQTCDELTLKQDHSLGAGHTAVIAPN